jgi:hypothetical protein
MPSTPDASNDGRFPASKGGRGILDETLIDDDIGKIGIFIDTEGNRVEVHPRHGGLSSLSPGG